LGSVLSEFSARFALSKRRCITLPAFAS